MLRKQITLILIKLSEMKERKILKIILDVCGWITLIVNSLGFHWEMKKTDPYLTKKWAEKEMDRSVQH